MTDENPIRRPMTALLDESVRAAKWLQDADQYKAAIQVARMCAIQVDELSEAGASDPDTLRQTHMRVIPNLAKALHALGLTPEGYAKMTGVQGGAAAKAPKTAEESSPFSQTATPSPADELNALVEESANVVQMRRP